MFLIIGMAAALVTQAPDGGDAGATVEAKLQAAKEAYGTCIITQTAQLYHGRDDRRLEQKIGETCNGKFEDWAEAMSPDGVPGAKAAAKDAMLPILKVAIHLAVQAEAEARRTGRRVTPT